MKERHSSFRTASVLPGWRRNYLNKMLGQIPV